MELIEKKQIRDQILADQANSGLTKSEYAEKRLGLNKSWMSHLDTKWDIPGVIGDDTWSRLKKYITGRSAYKCIATRNYIDIVHTCDRALQSKRALSIIGEGGYGKTKSLELHKEKLESEKIKVYYLDAKGITTRKRLVVALLVACGCYKEGIISNQLEILRSFLMGKDALVMIDEASALEGTKVTYLKDILTALRGVCGVVVAGTPYLLKNLERGAAKDRFLYSETRDRFFSLATILHAPEDSEAEAIFRINGIDGKWLKILMGEMRGEHLQQFYWRNKPTFRGIEDAITLVRIAMTKEREISYLMEV